MNKLFLLGAIPLVLLLVVPHNAFAWDFGDLGIPGIGTDAFTTTDLRIMMNLVVWHAIHRTIMIIFKEHMTRSGTSIKAATNMPT